MDGPTRHDYQQAANPTREERLAMAVAEYLDLIASQEAANLTEFCARFPDLAPELRQQLEQVEEVDSWFGLDEEAIANLDEESPPETLSGYRILGQIGAGGMGRVYLAYDDRLNRKLAIKVLSPHLVQNPLLKNRFMREARAMASVNHPHIARIYSLGGPDEIPHFVMEYVEGKPLTEVARGLPVAQKVELLRKVLQAVDFLHRQGVLHRDLKPGNILVGADLEPKILDFGLALQAGDQWRRLTKSGEIVGTPDYFAPEQTGPGNEIDARSDVFALGAIFYEMLTGQLPFKGETLAEQLESIRSRAPELPRRINRTVPGPLQDICLAALEKKPEDRYVSALAMAADLERFIAGEPVLATPRFYSQIMGSKVEQHLAELNSWKDDKILSQYEFDAFRRLYGRLFEREDAWILEMRRFSLSQVSLYLGGWILVVGVGLLALFDYRELSGIPNLLLVTASAAVTAFIGVREWKGKNRRIAIAYLLAFCLILPIGMIVAMHEWGLLLAYSNGNQEWELFSLFESFRMTTNDQMWWSLFLSLPVYLFLRRFTGASVFSLVFAMMGALLGMVTLLRLGMLEWLDSDPGRVYFQMVPIALVFFAVGFSVEKLRLPSDSRYFYPFAVVFTLVAFSGVAAFHEPWARRLEAFAPITRGQVEYLFLINAGIYFALQTLCDGFPSAQMRLVAKAFRFMIPWHILLPLLQLGLSSYQLWQEDAGNVAMRTEARFFEISLPLVAGLFVFGSIPKQMKNFFISGMSFLAIGIIRLQQDLFKEQAAWPVALLVAGGLLMLAAARYTRLRVTLRRFLRRR